MSECVCKHVIHVQVCDACASTCASMPGVCECVCKHVMRVCVEACNTCARCSSVFASMPGCACRPPPAPSRAPPPPTFLPADAAQANVRGHWEREALSQGHGGIHPHPWEQGPFVGAPPSWGIWGAKSGWARLAWAGLGQARSQAGKAISLGKQWRGGGIRALHMCPGMTPSLCHDSPSASCAQLMPASPHPAPTPAQTPAPSCLPGKQGTGPSQVSPGVGGKGGRCPEAVFETKDEDQDGFTPRQQCLCNSISPIYMDTLVPAYAHTCTSLSFLPPQGDVQQLLIVPDPAAAQVYCERYMPGCNVPLAYPLQAPFPEQVGGRQTHLQRGRGWGQHGSICLFLMLSLPLSSRVGQSQPALHDGRERRAKAKVKARAGARAKARRRGTRSSWKCPRPSWH